MAATTFPPRWHEVVRRHVADTVGYVVAESGKCLEVQTQELKPPVGRVPGRDFQPLRPAELARIRLPASWFMAIVLCPGENLSAYARWYANLSAKDRHRVVFFFHPAFAVDGSDQAWGDAEVPPPRTQRFNGSWEDFHRLYGRRHSDQVFEDHLSEKRR